MASEYRFIEFFEIFREGCFQGDFFFGIFVRNTYKTNTKT